MSEDRNYEPMTAAERMRRYRARQRGADVPETSWNRKMKPGPKAREPHRCRTEWRSYPADSVTPIRHVATELEKTGTAGLSVAELAATYDHPIPSDLNRIKVVHGCVTNDEAVRYMIDRAIRQLGLDGYVKEGRSTKSAMRYRLAVPFDEIRWQGQPVYRWEE